MNGPIGHLVVMASAGSGKTHLLTSRYISLLHHGARPETIVALTFTRKAAGEIFDKIVRRLATVVKDEQARSALNSELALAERPVTEAKALEMLRHLIRAMPLLRIGTLDSFLAQICGAYSFELGLQGLFQLVDGHEKSVVQQEALKESMAAHISGKELQEFSQAFKNATYGDESKRVSDSIQAFIEEYYAIFLKASDAVYWGRQKQIWPSGSRWFQQPPLTAGQFSERCNRLQSASRLPAWESLVNTLRSFDRDTFLLKGNTLLDKCFEQVDDLMAGTIELSYNRKPIPLTSEQIEDLSRIIHSIMRSVLDTRMKKTRGIYQLLQRYEQLYSRRMRESGNLTFEDMPILLGGQNNDAPILLTQNQQQAAINRLRIDYRLDGKFDHWLLDEFQDTSRQQWYALANLIDEVVQDAGGERSFFYVGDVKQAIYGWRGGDSRLFENILNRYRKNMHVGELNKSWRSAPAIINTVNRVFESLPGQQAGLPSETITRWRSIWRPHETVQTDPPGYAVMLQAEEKTDQAGVDATYAITAQLIRRVQQDNPEAGLGILVRGNQTGRALTDYLRAQKIDVSWEGDSPLNDNTVISSLLALLKLAEHPGDELAWRQINMTPLKPLLPRRSKLSLQLLYQVHHQGFYPTLRHWAEACRESYLVDGQPCPFTRERIRQLLHIAATFDQTGNRRVLEFIDHVQTLKTSEVTYARGIRIMTIHKAKGLEFDAVILPEVGTRSMDDVTQRGIGLMLKEQPVVAATRITPEPEWVLYYPGKPFYACDPTLNDAIAERKIDQAYESLCTLYVALTRARQALYILLPKPPERTNVFSQARLLQTRLGEQEPANPQRSAHAGIHPPATAIMPASRVLYETGTRDWSSTARTESGAMPVRPRLPRLPRDVSPRNRPERMIPSEEGETYQNAAQLFSLSGRHAAEYGTAIHALFEQIEWFEPGHTEIWIRAWRELHPVSEPVARKAEMHFRKALEKEAVQSALSKPAPHAEVWRERRFEAELQTSWISGCFDRVTILRDAQGQAQAATILDFKSNKIDNEETLRKTAESYQPQLEQYRRVLSKTLGLPGEYIQTQLLFSDVGVVT